MKVQIIPSGKKAGLKEVRSAILLLREESPGIEVRLTWEHGDREGFVNDASRDGGDGTVNEFVNALGKKDSADRPELAIAPLGTANGFTTACNIPLIPLDALRSAIHGAATAMDIARANDRDFVNIASVGFGAEVTAQTTTTTANPDGSTTTTQEASTVPATTETAPPPQSAIPTLVGPTGVIRRSDRRQDRRAGGEGLARVSAITRAPLVFERAYPALTARAVGWSGFRNPRATRCASC
jgi:hypothetical protein